MRLIEFNPVCGVLRFAGLMAVVVVFACPVAIAQEDEDIEIEIGPVLDLTRLSSLHHVYPVDLRLAERFVREVPEPFPVRPGELGVAETASADMLPWWMMTGSALPRPGVQGANWVDLRIANKPSVGVDYMTIHGPERTRIENRVDVAVYTNVLGAGDTGLSVLVEPEARKMRIGSLLRAAAAEERRLIVSSPGKHRSRRPGRN